ncbi:hypothetical protein ACD591_14300 [Rufibacter glacialis]|uniref:Uncharacterized protein n=1 Tax=Rufibacter glacialis TaxID=1259555 RepID=A0A5M8Q7Y7_9BACT|nr:hypothetical protein [Rufibacter glacialis]KAA6430986.1 hypothetical protein FOE74_17930 [Rufibacter glacialis]GGK83088.1 hypothetical protein GCM10011405_33630 [Rufibacter glacialis]
MFIALTILLIIALFITVYYVRANKAGASSPEGTTTRISGGGPDQPATPGQTTKTSFNPGSVPDGSGHDKGQGGAAMSSGMQG